MNYFNFIVTVSQEIDGVWITFKENFSDFESASTYAKEIMGCPVTRLESIQTCWN